MTEKKDECGVKYTPDVLEDRWQPRIIFWLGFRPFTIDGLHQLLPELTDVALKEEITSLQNLRIVALRQVVLIRKYEFSPIKLV